MRVERQLILYSIPFLVFLAAAGLTPVLYILAKSVSGGLALWGSVFAGRPSQALPGWDWGLSMTLLWEPLARSVYVGVGATLLSVGLGAAFAVLVATSDLRYKRAFVYSEVLQFVIPPLTIAQFWVVASSLFRLPPFLVSGPLPMVLVLGVHFQSLVFLIVNASLRRLDQTVVDAALVSGARYRQVVRRVILPLAVPSIMTASALSLFFNLSAFTPLFILGTGSSPYYTLSMQVYAVYLGSILDPVSTQ
ncbi:MAG: ABC transporter permease subunit, partial [Nitrososphaerales archaeon]